MNLDDELRRALAREPAPPGFAGEVLARSRSPRPRILPFWKRPVTLAVAAVLALAAVVPSAVHEYRRRQRAIEARDQLLLALSITRVQLEQVRTKIQRNTRHKK